MTDFTPNRGWDSYTFTVGEHFLPGLINGEVGPLTDGEEALLAEFETQACLADKVGHWSHEDDGLTRFARCDITGLRGNCVNIQFMFIVNPEQHPWTTTTCPAHPITPTTPP